MRNKESGQGLIEYALILSLVAVIVRCIICLSLFLLISHWSVIALWGTGIVVGVQAGNPYYIFTAIVIVLIALWVIFGGRHK